MESSHRKGNLPRAVVLDFAYRIYSIYIQVWWGAGMVICLERGADLHMAQLMPLPFTVSCISKIQIGFTFLTTAYPDSPRKRAIKHVYTVSQKNNTPNSCPYLYQILTDFQTFFTDGHGSKFATFSCLNIPPRLKYVATLPCEITMLEKWRQSEICIVINDKSH